MAFRGKDSLAEFLVEPARLVQVGPGTLSRLHLGLLRAAIVVSRILFGLKGLNRITLFLGRFFGRKNFAVFHVFGSGLVMIPLADPLWMPPLLSVGRYESEVEAVLAATLSPDCGFVDCGANIGWWSLFASGRIGTRGRVVAIEAQQSTFESLAHNAKLNGDSFACVHAAVWSDSNTELTLTANPYRPGGASVVRSIRGLTAKVPSLSLDDVIDTYLGRGAFEVIVKLDIEDAELHALAGLRRRLRDVAMIVYEDHGRHRSAEVTGAVLSLGYEVYFCDESLHLTHVRDERAAVDLKRNPNKGYNFFACRPDTHVWSRIRALNQS